MRLTERLGELGRKNKIIRAGSLFFLILAPGCVADEHFTNPNSSVVYSLAPGSEPCITFLAISAQGASEKGGLIKFRDSRTNNDGYAANANTYQNDDNKHDIRKAYDAAETHREAVAAVLEILADDPNWPGYEACDLPE